MTRLLILSLSKDLIPSREPVELSKDEGGMPRACLSPCGRESDFSVLAEQCAG